MPVTRMFICLDDPLRDDQLRMSRNLQVAGVDVKVKAFHHFIHGMLSLNRNECLPVRVFQDEVIAAMKEHFKPVRSKSLNVLAESTASEPGTSKPDSGIAQGNPESTSWHKEGEESTRQLSSEEHRVEREKNLSEGVAVEQGRLEPTNDRIDTPVTTEGVRFSFG